MNQWVENTLRAFTFDAQAELSDAYSRYQELFSAWPFTEGVRNVFPVAREMEGQTLEKYNEAVSEIAAMRGAIELVDTGEANIVQRADGDVDILSTQQGRGGPALIVGAFATVGSLWAAAHALRSWTELKRSEIQLAMEKQQIEAAKAGLTDEVAKLSAAKRRIAGDEFSWGKVALYGLGLFVGFKVLNVAIESALSSGKR